MMGHYDYNKVDDFIDWCVMVSEKNEEGKAFHLISKEIEGCSNRYLNDFIGGLNFIQSEKSLDFIESSVDRIERVSLSWGHLAASSNFSWHRAVKWLLYGRPLSLIALDGIMFCTTIGERLNQSLLMRELNPTLRDIPEPEEVSKVLLEYLDTDNVPRTQNLVEQIINNVYNKDE